MTGSGGTGGAPSCQPLSDACAKCSYNTCQDQYCQCYAAQDCVVLVGCLQACGAMNDPCQEDCLAQPGAKPYISQTFLLGDCVAPACAADCPGVTAAVPCQKCLFTNCAPQMNECLNDKECAQIVTCAVLCAPGDFACVFGCASGKSAAAQGKAQQVQQCSADPAKCKMLCGM